MRKTSPFTDLSRSAPSTMVGANVPLAGTRAQSVQRLQVGIGGVVFIILLVGLANLIQDSTREVDAAAVPEAAPAPEQVPAPTQNDPLVNAGVVPDLPDETQRESVAQPNAPDTDNE